MSILASRCRKNHLAPVTPVVTLNPADTNAHITLGSGNLTALNSNSSNSWITSRATFGRSSATANNYFEASPQTLFAFSGVMLGTSALVDGLLCGGDSTGYGYYNYSGAVYHNSNPTTYGAASVSPIGILLKNGYLYFRAAAGSWINSADPIAQTGGISVIAGTMFPAISLYQPSDRFNAMLFNGSTLGPLPAGSSFWGS